MKFNQLFNEMYDKNKGREMDYMSDIEEENKALTERVEELTRALKWCLAEMKYSAEIGQPISSDRIEFQMAAKALGELPE